MPLRQIQFECASKIQAETAVSKLEEGLPNLFSSFSYSRSDTDTWLVGAITTENTAAEDEEHLVSTIAATIGYRQNTITSETVPEMDWVSHSLSNLKPVHAGCFVVHGSHHKDHALNGSVPILIDAGLAFGTGHHETTSGCLIILTELLKRRAILNVLDLGCGSGVLAIAAAKKTHRVVTATDIDPIAIDVTRQNAVRNQVSTNIRTAVADGLNHPAILSHAPYDLVFANILAKPLKGLAVALNKATDKNSLLILSGILTIQEASILSAYRMFGFALRKRSVIGEWSTLLLEKQVRPNRANSCHLTDWGPYFHYVSDI